MVQTNTYRSEIEQLLWFDRSQEECRTLGTMNYMLTLSLVQPLREAHPKYDSNIRVVSTIKNKSTASVTVRFRRLKRVLAPQLVFCAIMDSKYHKL